MNSTGGMDGSREQSGSAYPGLHFGTVMSGTLCVPSGRCPWALVRPADPTLPARLSSGFDWALAHRYPYQKMCLRRPVLMDT